jgi:hypothetical protein
MPNHRNDDAGLHPSLKPAVSKGVYSLCYYVSFGAVYASRLAMEVIPPDSVVRHGLRDGAEAAREAWARTHEEDTVAESEMELPVEGEPVVDV